MIVVITSLELKNPFHFFFSYKAMFVVKQLKSSSSKQFKSTGFWTKHYTMSLWDNANDMKEFAHSGAHAEAMKASKTMAKEIWTRSLEMDHLPSWSAAKALLKDGKVLRF